MRPDEELLNEIRQRLDHSANELDELTLAKLGAARRRAVAAGNRSALFRLGAVLAIGRSGMVALMLAGLLTIASVMLKSYPPAQNELQALSLMEDMALLGAAEELEFYEELDFYLWVTDEQDSG
jgi:TPR repeat protein